MLSMKADANRKRIYLNSITKVLSWFFVKFKKQFSLTREANFVNCQKADLRAIHTENVPTCSFRGAA